MRRVDFYPRCIEDLDDSLEAFMEEKVMTSLGFEQFLVLKLHSDKVQDLISAELEYEPDGYV